MMTVTNTCNFVGSLTCNAIDKYREFEDGGAVLTLSIAIKSPAVKYDGEHYDRTDYAQIVVRGHLAKNLSALMKDDVIEVVAKLQSRSYEKNGEKRWVTEFLAEKIELKFDAAA